MLFATTPLLAAALVQPAPYAAPATTIAADTVVVAGTSAILTGPAAETASTVADAPASVPLPAKAPKPAFKPINHEEDYSAFRAVRDQNDWTRLKYIPLGGDSYASLGGELRLRGEYRGGERYGMIAQDDDGNFQIRARLWGDVHVGGVLRAFVDIEHAQSWGLDSLVTPIDQGKADIHQAFIEARLPVGEGQISARFGRQEMGLGSFTQFDMREGANARRSQDALRIMGKFGRWDGGLFSGYAVTEKLGSFDDVRNKDFRFRGAHLTHQWGGGAESLRVEGLFISSDRATLRFNNLPLGHDDRKTLSLRAVGAKQGWTLEVERQQQWGDYGALSIDANFTSATLAHSWTDGWKPRAALRFDRGSGDKDRHDDKAGTFAPLFPRPLTYNGDLGYQNITVLQPMISFFPASRLKMDASVAGLWRTQSDDAIHALSGAIIFDSAQSDERYFGTRYTLSGQYSLNPFTTLGFYTNYTDVTRNLVGGKDLFYAATYLTFRF
ncbi:alginate export family protein [Sphingopyxis yananensis]|uniref:alginate export family protein n=1 Tax=Sphingopyxis yananensis TaxID=2886687 RepID=UPI001D109E70|nr:alginate export family protein [Sphingopyxis yananensis]MCC2603070.1 alginate export family protein [Sphingopyxis yananensis]